MNETLKATMDMVHSVRQAASMKTKRNFDDFFSDRIIQAGSETSLIKFIERLVLCVDAKMGSINKDTIKKFIKTSQSLDAQAVLTWYRQQPRIAAMIVTLEDKKDYETTLDVVKITPVEKTGVAPLGRKFDVTITARMLSPLAHGGDIKAGNATLFRRKQIISTTGNTLELPFFAGNALRGIMRDLLADHFLTSIGLTPSRDKPPVELWFFHVLYAGGSLEENSTAGKALNKELGCNGSVRTKGVTAFRDTLPALSLIGTALGNRILCGRIQVGDLRPRCKEWSNGDMDVAELFTWEFLTRREDYENHEEHHGMIANTECLKEGTELIGGIDIDGHASDIERAALGRGLLLLKEKGFLGADSRRGYGKVEINTEKAPAPALYDAWLLDNKQKIVKYLEGIGAICMP